MRDLNPSSRRSKNAKTSKTNTRDKYPINLFNHIGVGVGTGVTRSADIYSSVGGSGGFANLIQKSGILTNGTEYFCRIKIQNYTSGSIRFSLGFNTNGPLYSADGIYLYQASANQTAAEGFLLRNAAADFVGDVIVLEVSEVER